MAPATDIRAPLEQEGTKAVVRKWLKSVGQSVRMDEPIVELETDKVAVEVAAEADGVLVEILMQPGADAEPGALLGRLEAAAPKATAGAAAPAPNAAKESGAKSFDWPSRPTRRRMAAFDPDLRLSPSVRRLLAEADIDPAGLKGSGRDGRLTRQDVEGEIVRRERAAAGQAAAPVSPPVSRAAALAAAAAMTTGPDTPTVKPTRPAAPPPPRPAGGAFNTIPHDSMRRRIAEHMSHSMAVAPHVTSVFEADFSAIMAHRAASKAEFQARGVNLTYTAYLVAAAAAAMAAAPSVNSRWFDDRLEVYGDVNIGVGTALGDKGLVVPVIKGAQGLSLFEIAERLQDLTDRARADRLTPADVRDGTFSISNHGVSGSLIATPIIIAQPQSAILGVGKLEKRVVVREIGGADAIQVRPMAYVSLTIDHRVIDAHQTNAWLARFVETLETWR